MEDNPIIIFHHYKLKPQDLKIQFMLALFTKNLIYELNYNLELR